MGKWLAERVPEDMMCTYSVAQVPYTFTGCEEHEGGETISAVVWQIHAFMVPLDPESGQKSISYNAIAPYEELQDGDTEWLEQYLDHMWNDVTFSQLVGGVDHEIEQAAQEPEV